MRGRAALAPGSLDAGLAAVCRWHGSLIPFARAIFLKIAMLVTDIFRN